MKIKDEGEFLYVTIPVPRPVWNDPEALARFLAAVAEDISRS